MSILSFPNTLTLIPSLSITASQRLPTSRKSQAVKSTKTSNKTFRTPKKRSKSPKQNNTRKPSKEELELIEEPSPSTWTTLPLRDDAQSLLGNALKPTKPLTHKDFFTEEDASDSDEDFEFAANDYPEFYGEPSYKSKFYEEPSDKNEFYEEPSKENGFYEEPSKEKGFSENTRKKTDFYEETRSAKPSTSKYSLKFDEYDDDDITVSEKGVPAVMRCFDKTKIFIKAGDGGNGVVAFRREKFVPMGGPSGGNGGKGGSIYLEVDDSVNSLLGFRKGIHFRAGNGKNGHGRNMDGAKGEDVVIKVAPGTIVRDPNDGSVLLELTKPGQKVMVLPGGRGGRGNASFKCEKNKAPKIAENGEEGIEMWLDLELKLVADVGIIGIPNAGKSTFLSTISAAKPSIADYPFTTLLPNLGVVSLDYNATMVVADLPGLLEGAHRGYGLGHEFLRHTERCHVLIHIVDGTSSQPDYEFEAVRLELDLFNPELAHKPFVVAFNKMDIPEAANRWKSFEKYMVEHNITGFCMSAATKSGTKELISTAYELLKKNAALQDKTPATVYKPNGIQEMLSHKKNARLDEFEIDFENETRTWSVQGAALERFIQMTNWEYIDSYKRFQSILEACGVDRTLKQRGVKEGDTVIVGQMELEWHDATDFSNVIDNRRYSRGSTKWRRFS